MSGTMLLNDLSVSKWVSKPASTDILHCPFYPYCPGVPKATPQIMHHAFKAWCIVSMSDRFAIIIPDFLKKSGIFLTFVTIFP